MGQDTQALALATIGLTKPAKLCLVAMCYRARDATGTGDTAHYYGSWEWLGIALGYDKWDRAAERTVARCIRELTTAGYVERTGQRAGRVVVYALFPRTPPT